MDFLFLLRANKTNYLTFQINRELENCLKSRQFFYALISIPHAEPSFIFVNTALQTGKIPSKIFS